LQALGLRGSSQAQVLGSSTSAGEVTCPPLDKEELGRASQHNTASRKRSICHHTENKRHTSLSLWGVEMGGEDCRN